MIEQKDLENIKIFINYEGTQTYPIYLMGSTRKKSEKIILKFFWFYTFEINSWIIYAKWEVRDPIYLTQTFVEMSAKSWGFDVFSSKTI
jgi:hypothetical protein